MNGSATVRANYRRALRTIRSLPDKGARVYYRNHMRSHLNAHQHEDDAETNALLREKLVEGIEFVAKKYNLEIRGGLVKD